MDIYQELTVGNTSKEHDRFRSTEYLKYSSIYLGSIEIQFILSCTVQQN